MGVDGLIRVIETGAPDAIIEVALADIVTQLAPTVGIDMSIMVYQMCSVGQQRNIVNANGKFINHIIGIFHRMIAFIAAGIVPVAVFDGSPPAIKAATLRRRAAARKSSAPIIPRAAFDEVRKMLGHMGIACVSAPGEAEAMAARFDIFATEDTDAIVHASQSSAPHKIIFGLSATGRARVVDVRSMLESLDLSPNQFLDLCAMLGCDYNDGLPGFGPASALEAIRAKKLSLAKNTPADILGAVNLSAVRDTFRAEYRAASLASIPPTPPANMGALRTFLVAHGIPPRKIDAGIMRLERIHARM